jgi:molybdate/tungstate transport system ATP-binding protein
MSAAGLDAHDLTLQLGAFALRGASLAVAPGEALVLLGPNGAGKSVCLEAIAGFHRLASGNIQIAGRDVSALPPEERRIGFVVQNFGLFPHLSVAGNVALGGRARGNHVDVAAMLNRFGVAHLAAARPTYLSPGEKQRVALARALASRPDLFLFDEPFAALDSATTFALRDELATFLREAGLPAVFVTHDHVEARALADHVAVIEAGVIQQCGRAAEVFDHPSTVAIARFLGIENLLEGRIASVEGQRIRVSVGGGVIEAERPDSLVAPGQSVTLCIRAENVHLFPLQSSRRPGVIAGHVVAFHSSGPLWTVTLDGGFRLIAYALPQTARACALALGASVDAEIDPTCVHVLVSPPGQRIAGDT